MEERREATMAASVLVLVKYGMAKHGSPSAINPLIAKEQWFSTKAELKAVTGGLREVVRRLLAGRILPAGSLGKWSPDFLSGLVQSGAMRKTKRASFWFTSPLKDRPALKAALTSGRLPFRYTVSICGKGPIGPGEYLALSGSWAFSLGADDPDSVSFLAGVLAGGRRVEHDGSSWLAISGRAENVALLESYGIPFIRLSPKVPKVGFLLVSPFWGALLVFEMPEEWKLWFDRWYVRRGICPMGMCPLLPWAFMKAAWGVKVSDGFPKLIVPYISSQTGLRTSYGLAINQVREQALVRFGFSRVDVRLRKVWIQRMKILGMTVLDFPRGKVPIDFE